MASQISSVLIETVPLDKDKIDTVIKRNIRITRKSINLIFWYLIIDPHLIVNNYCS